MPKKVCVVAHGQLNDSPKILAILSQAKYLVACDGACDRLVELGFVPKYIVGDMDSISHKNKTRLQNRLVVRADQNKNDLQKALEFCEDLQETEIDLVGISGKREDHLIANVFILLLFPDLNIKCQTDFGGFRAIWKKSTFGSCKGQQVSIFSLDPRIKINSRNLKFPLHNLQLQNLTAGTLNEALAPSFELDISHGAVLVFQADQVQSTNYLN